jgi:hypothetical protein
MPEANVGQFGLSGPARTPVLAELAQLLDQKLCQLIALQQVGDERRDR